MATAKPPRQIIYTALDLIAPAEVNPKGHDEGEIGASIGRFGFIESMIMDERTDRLVGGHGRLEELRRRRDEGEDPPEGVVVIDGLWHAPVTRGWSSRSDEEAMAAGIALNRIGERGGWDVDVLYDELTALSASDYGLDGLGFNPSDLDDLSAAVALAPIDVPDSLDPLPAEHSNDQTSLLTHAFAVVIDCHDEAQQLQLLDRFTAEGLAVRALTA